MKKILLLLAVSLFCLSIFTGCSEVYSEHALKVGENEKYQTIQSAIDSSEFTGQIILISSGVYEENLSITKPVQIVGKSNSVRIIGSVTISASGVGFKKIAFDGDSKVDNGIIIDSEKDIDSLFLENCTIQNYKKEGMMSASQETERKKFEHVTMINCRFRKNKGAGLYCDNVSSARLIECDFENNGSGINFQFAGGNYKAISIADCEFRSNGEKTNGEAIKFALRGKTGDGEFSPATYSGYITIDNCLFQSNAKGIENGIENIDGSQVNYEILNTRGMLPAENDFSSLK